MEAIITLNAILVAGQIQAAVKAKVKGYIDSLLKFETILTAQAYLQAFSHATTLSKYLKTVQLDLLIVHLDGGWIAREYADAIGMTSKLVMMQLQSLFNGLMTIWMKWK